MSIENWQSPPLARPGLPPQATPLTGPHPPGEPGRLALDLAALTRVFLAIPAPAPVPTPVTVPVLGPVAGPVTGLAAPAVLPLRTLATPAAPAAPVPPVALVPVPSVTAPADVPQDPRQRLRTVLSELSFLDD